MHFWSVISAVISGREDGQWAVGTVQNWSFPVPAVPESKTQAAEMSTEPSQWLVFFACSIVYLLPVCKMPVGKVLRRSLSPMCQSTRFVSVRAYRNNHLTGTELRCSATAQAERQRLPSRRDAHKYSVQYLT